MERLIISVAVGYMLKVLKSGRPITEYKKEFDSIRHGDYVKFIDLIKGPIPYLAVYKYGSVVSGHIPPSEDDINFELLLKSAPSLKLFYTNCMSAYGPIQDFDLKTETYEKAALFEITLRMHATNEKLITTKDLLKNVIDRLGTFKSIPASELELIHGGRKFINMIKHPKDQFPSWSEGAEALDKAFTILAAHDLNY